MQAVAILMVCVRVIISRMTKIIMVALQPQTNLAQAAQIGNGSRVADFCAGLGGTVCYLAHRYGANVTGIELTPARVAGAQELTKRVAGTTGPTGCR